MRRSEGGLRGGGSGCPGAWGRGRPAARRGARAAALGVAGVVMMALGAEPVGSVAAGPGGRAAAAAWEAHSAVEAAGVSAPGAAARCAPGVIGAAGPGACAPAASSGGGARPGERGGRSAVSGGQSTVAARRTGQSVPDGSGVLTPAPDASSAADARGAKTLTALTDGVAVDGIAPGGAVRGGRNSRALRGSSGPAATTAAAGGPGPTGSVDLAGPTLPVTAGCGGFADRQEGSAGARPSGAPGPAGELRVTILHTSDEHSAVLPVPLVDYRPGEAGPAQGGFARLAAAADAWRARKAAEGEPVLLTSAGDNLGGSPFSWLILEGEAPELSLMIEAGYDVVTFGNHEFDYGPDRLAGYLRAAGYPEAGQRTAVVATNMRPPSGHPLEQLGIRRTHLVTLPNGLRVGFLGLLGKHAVRVALAAEPVTFDDALVAAAAAAADLREAGAHVVVAITHSGLEEDRALARAVPAIDVILGGHEHRLLEEPEWVEGTPIVHTGTRLAQFAVIELGYDPETGAVRVRNPETGTPYVVPLDGSFGESDRLTPLIEAYRARLDARFADWSGGRIPSVAAVLARAEFDVPARPRLAETPFGDFVTDAMRHAVERATGEPVDFAFQANGNIRGDMVAGRAPWSRGGITAFDLAGAVGLGAGPDGLPGYPLITVWLTGDEVIRALEVSALLSQLLGNPYYLQVSGLRARYDPGRAILARIPVRGTPIPTGRAVLAAERETPDGPVPLARGDERLYRVVADRYVAGFLPMVGRLVPRLAIVPKDRDGRPIEDLDAAIVYRDGRELKVWQAVLEYAAAQPPGEDGVPRIPAGYAAPAGRLEVVDGPPIWAWPAAGLGLAGLLLGGVGAMVRKRRRTARAWR